MPPESRFDRLAPDAFIERAAVNMPSVNLDDVARNVRDDLTTYSPLRDPAGMVHGWSPPTPAPKTESTLRTELVAALEAQAHAADRLALAQSASDRAQAHLRQCNATLHTFDGLEAAISASVIEQLTDGDKARVEITADLDDCVGQRERARTAYAAAVKASEVLGADLVAARGAAAEAGAKVDRVCCAILSFEAGRIADQHAELLRQAASIAAQLLTFNLYAGPRGSIMPPAVRGILAGYDVSVLARQRDTSSWQAVASRLRADPMCDVTMSEP